MPTSTLTLRDEERLTLVPWTLFQVWAELLRARQLWVGYGLLQSSVMLGATAIFMVLAPLGQAESPSFFVFAVVAASTLLWGWDFLRNDRRTRKSCDRQDRRPWHLHRGPAPGFRAECRECRLEPRF